MVNDFGLDLTMKPKELIKPKINSINDNLRFSTILRNGKKKLKSN